MKASIHLLVKPLRLLFNLSLETGFVPSQITIATVIPLHKEGEKTQFNNYRPIAVISTIGKLLEKVIHQQLSDFLKSQDILTSSQFGFRTHHGVEHPLMLFANRVLNSLNNGKFNISIFIDLKKAFDTVNYSILLDKLEHNGVRGTALKWFRNYLVRKQYVVTGGEAISDILTMLCGIPQGTVLGPLLFLIFANDFASCSRLMSLLFADDCTLQAEGVDLPHLISLVNSQLEIAEKWFVANMLTLNIKKTKYVIFHPSPQLASVPTPPLTIGNDTLVMVGSGQEETSVRFLGILIDDKFTFKEHMSLLKKKLSKAIFALSSSKQSTPLRIRKTIYYSLFESLLRFGSLLFGCAVDRDLREIELLQKKAIRHIACAFYLAHTEPIFRSLGILKLRDLILLERCTLVHKFRHGKLPVAFAANFLTPVDVLTMSRRDDPECYSPPPNNHPSTPCSPTAKLISSWNSLPHHLKIIGCQKLFKSSLTQFFLDSYTEVCSELNCRACNYQNN